MNGVSQAHQAYHESGWWRDQTFLDDLHHHAPQQPGKTAVIGHNTATRQTDKVDYAELSRQTDRMALGLVGLGIRRGEYICVLLPDSGLPEQVVVFGDNAPAGALSFAEYFLDGPGRPGDDLAGRLLGPDEPYVLTFTSGTTGTTKAVMHSQNTLYAGLRGYAEALGFDHTLVNTAAHSNTYMAGLGIRLLTSLLLGSTEVSLDTWDPAASLDPVPGLDEGEGALWMRGPSQCLCYHKQDDLYAAELDEDGWFNTGDVVRAATGLAASGWLAGPRTIDLRKRYAGR